MRLWFKTLAVSATVLATSCSKPTAGGDEGGAGAGPGAPAAPGAAGAGNPAALGLAFLEGFEGEIDGFMKKAGAATPPMTMAALIKSGKFRFDLPEKLTEGGAGRMPGPSGVRHLRLGREEALGRVRHAQASHRPRHETASADAQIKSLGSHPGGPCAPQSPPPKITKTGKYETVAGYKCENWEVTSDHHEGTVCVAHEGFSWFAIPAAVLPSERAWMLELFDGKHFPLRFISYAKEGGAEETRLEITKIDKKALPDSDFTYPPDYRVMDMDQMFQALGGMPGGMGGGTAPGMPAGMPPGMPPGFTMPPMPHKAH